MQIEINNFKYNDNTRCKLFYIIDFDNSDDLKEYEHKLFDMFDNNIDEFENDVIIENNKITLKEDSNIIKSLNTRLNQDYPKSTLISVVDEYYNVLYANKSVAKAPTISYYLNNLIYDIKTKKDVANKIFVNKDDDIEMANKIMTDTLTNDEISQIMVHLKDSDVIIGVCLEVLGALRADGEEVVLDDMFSKDINFMKKAVDMYLPSFWLADIEILKNTTFFKYYLDKVFDIVGVDIIYDIKKIDSKNYFDLLELVKEKAQEKGLEGKLKQEIEFCFR